MKDAAIAYANALTYLADMEWALGEAETEALKAEAEMIRRRESVELTKQALTEAESRVSAAEAALRAIFAPPVVVPPLQNVRGSFGIAYKTTTNVPLYANKGSMIIAGHEAAVRADTPIMQSVRAGGGEVLQYIVPADIPDGLNSEFNREYYGGFGEPAYWPFANRSKWPKTRMADMTPDSPWLRYTVEFIVNLMGDGFADGMFLDTVGGMTYAAAANWDSWSAEEKDAYMLGNIWLVRELRKRLPNAILVSNSVWHRDDQPKGTAAAEGEKYVNGVCLEHHASTSTWHRNYVARPFMGSNRRVLVISKGKDAAEALADAVAWSKVPGVTHVSAQTTPEYTNPLAPAVAAQL
jgi:hypothetical protein